MALYYLSYDLRKQRNYQPLYDALSEFNAVRILESLWCFNRVNINSEGLLNYFRQFIDADDALSVSEVSVSNWATLRTLGTPNDLR